MKAFFLFFLFANFLSAQEITKIRVDFPKAHTNKELALSMFEEIKAVEEKDEAVLVAYKGALMAIKAKYSNKLNTKKQLLKKGIQLIELAHKRAPNNIEIRSIRLGVQENTPKFIGYHDNIAEDKLFIKRQYRLLKAGELKEYIKNFILQSQSFSEEEKKEIQ